LAPDVLESQPSALKTRMIA